MTPEPLHRRIRWENVGRVAALVALAAVVVLWPRLRAPAVEVPSGRAVPLARVETPEHAQAQVARAAAARPATPAARSAAPAARSAAPAVRPTKRHRTRRRRRPRPAAKRAPRRHAQTRHAQTQRAHRVEPGHPRTASPAPAAPPPVTRAAPPTPQPRPTAPATGREFGPGGEFGR